MSRLARLVPSTGVYPLGFTAGSVATGVKKKSQLDLTIVKSSSPCSVAGVFTTNKFAAAPVQLDKQILQSKKPVFGVLVNSGCANACTGDRGVKDALEMSVFASKVLANDPSPRFMVMSTGVIGQFLQMNKINKGIQELSPKLANSHQDWMSAAKGIMTTDTFPKLRSRKYTIDGKSFTVAGFSKGAGMIHPNMATMLACLFTDADIPQPVLNEMTRHIADRSFNAISVDGDTSTNDTFMILANGQSEFKATTPSQISQITDKLTEFATDLATLIVRDGEGATKFVKITVKNAESFKDAQLVANSVAKSPLVKTALYGKDANWGRIICAVGYSNATFKTENVDLTLKSANDSLFLFKKGAPFDTNEQVATRILQETDIELEISLGSGEYSHTVYTCDLSSEYVAINADYRS